MNLAQAITTNSPVPDIDRAHRELQGQRMEAIGRLAGGVAHDFNNLLTVIAGYTQMLIEDEQVSSDTKAVLQDIADAAQRASELTRQLLAYSRRQTIRTETVEVNGYVLKLEKLLRRIIGEDIELVTQLDADAGLARLDPSQFDQVLLNLAVNARDAMPRGGRLTVATEGVYLSDPVRREGVVMGAGPYVRISVMDTGIGMDATVAAHIFEPFFSTKEAGRGTGLGLATVYGIVKQHGGFIFVDTELGRGSTFEIYFPRTDAATPIVVSHAPYSARGGKEKVLLVEDEPALRKLAVEMLRKEGYELFEAGNGEEALEVLDHLRGRVDLILSDIIMPKLGGPELAKRASTKYPNLRFVFTSGYIDESLGQSRSLASCTDFVSKPFTRQALTRKVREVLDRTQRAA